MPRIKKLLSEDLDDGKMCGKVSYLILTRFCLIEVIREAPSKDETTLLFWYYKRCQCLSCLCQFLACLWRKLDLCTQLSGRIQWGIQRKFVNKHKGYTKDVVFRLVYLGMHLRACSISANSQFALGISDFKHLISAATEFQYLMPSFPYEVLSVG